MAVTNLDDSQVIRHAYDQTNKALRVRVAGPAPCPATEPADSELEASQVLFWVDETGHTFNFKVKYSDGTTVKTVTTPLPIS